MSLCDHAVHLDRGEVRPEAVYSVTFNNCHANLCVARGSCVGHPVCLECGNGFRLPGCRWKLSERVVSIRSITNS